MNKEQVRVHQLKKEVPREFSSPNDLLVASELKHSLNKLLLITRRL